MSRTSKISTKVPKHKYKHIYDARVQDIDSNARALSGTDKYNK